MDILSHGLYGGVLLGRKTKRSYWTAFFFGVFPDLFAFGLPILLLLVSFLSGEHAEFIRGPESGYENIPSYVFSLYDISHSIIVFTGVFFLVWVMRGKPFLEMLAWPLHIVVDIFTHGDKFFPTPFLWPISDFHVNGHAWSDPRIFVPNVILLIVFYSWWYWKRRQK